MKLDHDLFLPLTIRVINHYNSIIRHYIVQDNDRVIKQNRPYLLTVWCRVLLEKHFTEPEGSLPHSQASATCLYPGPAQSSPYTHIPTHYI